ncbi:MAG: hypothetical protein WA821_20515, partial [Anaerolineales bacterium]
QSPACRAGQARHGYLARGINHLSLRGGSGDPAPTPAPTPIPTAFNPKDENWRQRIIWRSARKSD